LIACTRSNNYELPSAQDQIPIILNRTSEIIDTAYDTIAILAAIRTITYT
jgi:hypothetical protein